MRNVPGWPKKLDDNDRDLIKRRVQKLTAEHHQKVDRLTKEFEKERKRLEDMLRLGFIPQSTT